MHTPAGNIANWFANPDGVYTKFVPVMVIVFTPDGSHNLASSAVEVAGSQPVMDVSVGVACAVPSNEMVTEVVVDVVAAPSTRTTIGMVSFGEAAAVVQTSEVGVTSVNAPAHKLYNTAFLSPTTELPATKKPVPYTVNKLPAATGHDDSVVETVPAWVPPQFAFNARPVTVGTAMAVTTPVLAIE